MNHRILLTAIETMLIFYIRQVEYDIVSFNNAFVTTESHRHVALSIIVLPIIDSRILKQCDRYLSHSMTCARGKPAHEKIKYFRDAIRTDYLLFLIPLDIMSLFSSSC